MAFVYDKANHFPRRVNQDNVVYQRLESTYWENSLKELIELYARETNSLHGQNILNQWDITREAFWQVCPKELLDKLEYPLQDAVGSIAGAFSKRK